MTRPLALVALALCALALAPAAHAAMSDQTDFTQAYYVRAAAGDIPATMTPTVEPEGQWNIVQYIRLVHTQGTASTATFGLPAGATADGFSCSCASYTTRQDGALYLATVNATEPAGNPVVAFRSHAPLAGAWALSLPAPSTTGDASVNLYVPTGSIAESNLAAGPSPGLRSTDGRYLIYEFHGQTSDLQTAWFTVHPGTASTVAAPATPMSPWLFAVAGLVVGCILWALLVARGIVQKRSRRQVAAVAAHVEAATNEPPAVLEAKKRFLMGALKDVELAKQNGELENNVYDAVKADFKRQTVTVMRAIEEAAAAAKDAKA